MKTIGSILLDVELVTPEDIDQALDLQKQTGQRLGEVLVHLGIVSDDDIRWALAEQLNLPYVNIRKDQIDTDVAMMLPEKLARRYHVIPILKIDDELTVVVDDPLNTTVIHDIEAITKSRVKVSLGRTSDILLAIDEIYGRSESPDEQVQETPPVFLSPWFSEEDMQQILNDPSGHALIQTVLETALRHQVSRIYFQPGFTTCYISYRMKGVLQHQIQLDAEWYSIAMFRLKISAGLDVSKHRFSTSQEIPYWEHFAGTPAPDGEEQTSIAILIFPTEAGESAVLHFVNQSLRRIEEQETEQLELAGSSEDLYPIRKIKSAMSYLQTGGILVGGAPYHDKITTLYTLLQALDPRRKNIVTVEAYTEYSTDSYSQVRYQREIDAAFHASGQAPASRQTADSATEDETSENAAAGSDAGQRALLAWLHTLHRQGADVILLDHVASEPVLAQYLKQAAHRLMLGACDFSHVFDMLAYCLECRIKPSVITSRLYALLAQQTIHLLCPECKEVDTSDFAKGVVDQFPDAVREQHEGAVEVFRPVGCKTCSMTGYTQSQRVFEVLMMEPWLKEMLGTGQALDDIRAEAGRHGFVPLEDKCRAILLAGATSIEQVLSIVTQQA